MVSGRIPEIEKTIDKAIQSDQIYESIVMIESTDGGFSYSRGSGGRDPDSPIIMASITKMFTTTCILALIEQGKLSLDNTLAEYFDTAVLSGLHIHGGREYSFDLTIADLLFQISGLPDRFEEGNDSLKNRLILEDFPVTFDELVSGTKKLTPHFAPRTAKKAYYADINFDMLGKILEKVTALPLAEIYRHYISGPLALKNTYLPQTDHDFVPAMYYRDKRMHRPKFIRSSGASGGCITTARELMIFIRAFFCGRLFSSDYFQTLSLSNPLQASLWPISYGSGYMRIPLNGFSTLFRGKGELTGHTGSTGSFAFYYPVKDLFFVGDFNQMANPALPVRLSMQLAMKTRTW